MTLSFRVIGVAKVEERFQIDDIQRISIKLSSFITTRRRHFAPLWFGVVSE